MGERVKALREKLGITQEEFSQRLGTTRNTITNYEANRRAPMDATIKSICREFDVNEEWLRTGEGEMFTQMSRTDEISAFVGNILRGEPDFRQKFISVLARMTPDEWQLLEKKVLELSEEIKKADP
ncbi:helix-turn-helix transcriptional regulator [uncultured Oscillibacter sp.]|uniref:helix-turn-helix domain-containing protein n=1 Tax=Anaerotruncus sp. 1XD42-93 TaxID=2320853 RepID=UPI000EA2BE08|nr:helix-turn-helix transcriptional regulator [uncultured Oscillibacter sp.]NBK19166.1 XRE family transcriptional regulator [Anaerotruncus sp. 1XD42-93]RKJ82501.1 XRE family transcriptional regulator [Anaerotruncus sp. 1XD22-93]